MKYNKFLYHILVEYNKDGVVIFRFLVGSGDQKGEYLSLIDLLKNYSKYELLNLRRDKPTGSVS